MINIDRELRVMHACELGAVGVYRGHKCVARYFYRKGIASLDEMRTHERDHAKIFANSLKQRNGRLCFGSTLFFIGGLFYGVTIGLLGPRAIGVSTFTIESIVDREFDIVLAKLASEPALCERIRAVQLEEREHRDSGAKLYGDGYWLSGPVSWIATAGAYAAQFLASKL